MDAANIALSEDKPDFGRIEYAVKLACLDKMVHSLPLGLYTKIGPSGKELSGGERQRLLIARAIYRNTPILLLDEATSSLDAETETKIVENLKTFGLGRTMVIAAHRLSTVKKADCILFIENGRLIEQGTHDALCSDYNSRYHQFIANQIG